MATKAHRRMAPKVRQAVQAGPQPPEQHTLGCQTPDADLQRGDFEDSPGGPAVKNPTSSAGDGFDP